MAVQTTRSQRLLRGVVGSLVFLVAAQVFTLLAPVNPIYLPDASTVVETLLGMLPDPSFWSRIGVTLTSWAAGLALATVIGTVAGIALGASALLYRLTHRPLELLRPIPAVALIPLFIVIFGQNFQANMWLVFYASIWPILLNALYGMHDVKAGAREAARSFGLNRIESLLRVELPSALPLIFTGIRVSGAIALAVAVAAEMLVAQIGGIGSLISELSLTSGSMAPTYAAVAAAGILGLIVNAALRGVENVVMPWRVAAESSS